MPNCTRPLLWVQFISVIPAVTNNRLAQIWHHWVVWRGFSGMQSHLLFHVYFPAVLSFTQPRGVEFPPTAVVLWGAINCNLKHVQLQSSSSQPTNSSGGKAAIETTCPVQDSPKCTAAFLTTRMLWRSPGKTEDVCVHIQLQPADCFTM